MKKTPKLLILIAIAMGMGGEMHIYFPAIGTIAMLDLISYVIALPIVIMNWNKMGPSMRCSLKWAFAWTTMSMLSNFCNFINFVYWLKCVAIASSSWAIIAAAYLLLRHYSVLYLWYLVGTGIGGWIALYHFRNGALEAFATKGDFRGGGYGTEFLMEKQIYPSIARGILLGCILPLFIWVRKMPVFLVLVATFGTGFYLLFNGGSRSNFGMFCAAGLVGFFSFYCSNLYSKLVQNRFLLTIGCIIGVSILFGGYRYFALSGKLEEGELEKYEAELGDGSDGAIKGRTSFDNAFKDCLESGGVGVGWHGRYHSVITNSLACEGIIGFMFWIYFYWQCLWFVSRRSATSSVYSVFILLMLLSACWDVFGSPFGTRHKFFVLMAFIALCKDNEFYGYGDIFGLKNYKGFLTDQGKHIYENGI